MPMASHSTSLGRAKPLVLMMLTAMLAVEALGADRQWVKWYAVHAEIAARNESLSVGDNPHTFVLRAGWSCSVGPTSKQMPAYETRTTTCQKGMEVFEFSVQCEPLRLKDHTQIRFRHPDKGLEDFIEVGCELTGSRQ